MPTGNRSETTKAPPTPTAAADDRRQRGTDGRHRSHVTGPHPDGSQHLELGRGAGHVAHDRLADEEQRRDPGGGREDQQRVGLEAGDIVHVAARHSARSKNSMSRRPLTSASSSRNAGTASPPPSSRTSALMYPSPSARRARRGAGRGGPAEGTTVPPARVAVVAEPRRADHPDDLVPRSTDPRARPARRPASRRRRSAPASRAGSSPRSPTPFPKVSSNSAVITDLVVARRIGQPPLEDDGRLDRVHHLGVVGEVGRPVAAGRRRRRPTRGTARPPPRRRWLRSPPSRSPARSGARRSWPASSASTRRSTALGAPPRSSHGGEHHRRGDGDQQGQHQQRADPPAQVQPDPHPRCAHGAALMASP